MIMDKKKIIYFVCLIITGIVLISLTVSYAFFGGKITGGESGSTLMLEGGSLEIVVNGGSNITADDFMPNNIEPWVVKEITLTGKNSTNMDMPYYIKIVEDVNEFETTKMKYTIESENVSNNGVVSPNMNIQTNINSGEIIAVGHFDNTNSCANGCVHKYRISVYFIDNLTDQSEDMGAKYNAKVEVSGDRPAIEGKIYGVRRDVDTSSSAWERTHDAVGLVANAQFGTTAVQNDFDNIYPWSEIISYNYKYNSTTGVVTETEYGDSAFKFDGTNGEVLTRIPEFYYRRYQQTESDGKTYEYLQISKDYIEGFTKSETFSVGRYTISGSASDVHSKSGVQPLGNKTITDFRNYIRNTSTLGNDFGQMDYHYFILQLLYLVEYADYNTDTTIGNGVMTSTAMVQSGGCDNLGMKTGKNGNNGTFSIIYRGIEDIYGNIGQWVDGVNIRNYVTYICYNPQEYDEYASTGCYNPIGYINSSDYNKYIVKLGYDVDNPLVAIPIALGGSTTTYIPDWYSSNPGDRILNVGGDFDNSRVNGLWRISMAYKLTEHGTSMGARLLRTN